MELESEEPLPKFSGGQFLHIEVPDKLLRRPLGIVKMFDNLLTVIYAVVGEGTQNLSNVKSGHMLKAILPLGNGFAIPGNAKRIAILGGGLGAAPLLPVISAYKEKDFYSYLGFACKDNIILEEDFKAVSKRTVIATDDGSYGFKGYALNAFQKDLQENNFDMVLACGPTSMLKAIKNAKLSMPVFVSLEERMGCGVGACLVCACKINRNGIKNLRVCADGPVFDLNEVVL